MKSIKKRLSLLSFLLCMPIMLGGCSAVYLADKFPEFTPLGDAADRQDWTYIRRANNAAADVLYQHAKPKLARYHKVVLIRLNNLGEPLAEGVAPVSWLIPQQVGNRLVQLGMNVEQPNKAPLYAADKRADGTLPLQLVDTGAAKPSGTKRKSGHLYVEGDYAYLEDDVLISLRLIDGGNDTILSSVEYDLEVDANMIVLIDPSQPDRLFDTGWMH